MCDRRLSFQLKINYDYEIHSYMPHQFIHSFIFWRKVYLYNFFSHSVLIPVNAFDRCVKFLALEKLLNLTSGMSLP